eukprot:gene19793-23678_t
MVNKPLIRCLLHLMMYSTLTADNQSYPDVIDEYGILPMEYVVPLNLNTTTPSSMPSPLALPTIMDERISLGQAYHDPSSDQMSYTQVAQQAVAILIAQGMLPPAASAAPTDEAAASGVREPPILGADHARVQASPPDHVADDPLPCTQLAKQAVTMLIAQGVVRPLATTTAPTNEAAALSVCTETGQLLPAAAAIAAPYVQAAASPACERAHADDDAVLMGQPPLRTSHQSDDGGTLTQIAQQAAAIRTDTGQLLPPAAIAAPYVQAAASTARERAHADTDAVPDQPPS